MKSRFLKYSVLLLVLISCGALVPFEEKDKASILTEVIKICLDNYHFSPGEVNDKMSEKIYDIYLERLDYSKKFLLETDIEKLNEYKEKVDDELLNKDFKFFELARELIVERTEDAEEYYKTILAKPFKFDKEEFVELDPKKLDYAKNTKELKDRWRKYLKHQTLQKVTDLEAQQQKLIDNPDTTITPKPFKELEAEAREKVMKSHEQWFKRLSKLNDQDRLSSYINSFTAVYDPHTNYYPPKDKENFDISMSGRLEGIGATLQEKDGYIKVIKIVPGSASWRQGELKAGHVILKVGQGETEPVDIVDMRLDDAVKLIRGKKGTEVRLTVRIHDGTEKIIPIVRDIVVLEETYAKSLIVYDSLSDKRYGYVYLPKFYRDFNDPNGRKCSEDVKDEITKLKKDGIDGLMIDLRDNGGGSLQDVVEMGGLFIEKGPIVQVKPRGQEPQILEDTDAKVHYDGKLVIMINELSASASEILAAAMQDYKRAVIMGSPSSYGKGTVQRFIDLDYFLNDNFKQYKPLGSMKLTIQKFYRINGGATQIEGVKSDVVVPGAYMYIEVGENELEHAMPWDEISPVKYDIPKGYLSNLEEVKAKSKARTDKDSIFQLIEMKAKYFDETRDKTKYALNIDDFKAKKEYQKKQSKKYEDIRNPVKSLNFAISKMDQEVIKGDSTKTTRMDNWKKELKKDPYIFEAIHILDDMK